MTSLCNIGNNSFILSTLTYESSPNINSFPKSRSVFNLSINACGVIFNPAVKLLDKSLPSNIILKLLEILTVWGISPSKKFYDESDIYILKGTLKILKYKCIFNIFKNNVYDLYYSFID